MTQDNDPFGLQRFVDAQEWDYATALAELRAGAKRSHWIWYVLPQMAGLSARATSQAFGIKSRAQARAYVDHPVLGARLVECVNALLAVEGRTARQILGTPDDLKFRSSLTLFAAVAPEHPEFRAALAKYYGGAADEATLRLLAEADRQA